MIVILMILLMTQIGNLWSLFQQKEKSQVEEIAVQILWLIDEEKTNALLGKTYKKTESWIDRWAIVRKRSISLNFDNDKWDITLISRVNLAESKEAGLGAFEPETVAKKWHLEGLEGSWYACSGNAEGEKIQNGWIDIEGAHINFISDAIDFGMGDIANPDIINTPHIVFKVSGRNRAQQEIHIERRTWLTYARVGLSDKVLCN